MKDVKQKSNAFLTKFVSLFVAEVFLCSSILPAWATPNDFLRPRPARSTGEVMQAINHQEARDEGDETAPSTQKIRQELIQRFGDEKFYQNDNPLIGLDFLLGATTGTLHDFIAFYREKASKNVKGAYRYFEESLREFKKTRQLSRK